MPNTIRIKRRTGLSGAPSTLWGAELAYNELDHILYIGEGTGGSGGTATTIQPIAGPGAFVTLSTAQTIDGAKTFTSNVAINAGSITSTSSSFDVLPTSTAINIGALNGTTTVRNDLHVGGDLTIIGDTFYTGNVEVGDILTVDSGIINTTSTSGSIFNTVASSLNIGGEAILISIGSASGKTTINNANTVISGFLSASSGAKIAGNLAVNGGTLTTSASSLSLFNTNALTVTAFQNATTVNIGADSGTTAIKNSATVAGNLGVSANTTITGDLAVNGGDITSTASTFNVLATPTTINIGALATALNLGATSGTTTVKNNLVVDGGSTFTANVDFTQSVVIGGDLTVNGSLTAINSTTLQVEDKNIELGTVPGGTPTNATANGGGITLLGDTSKTIIWDSTYANWTSSENWNIASGKTFKINNVDVLSSTTLGAGIIYSSLTTLGTITSGTWHGSTVAATYGGTGYSSYTKGDMLWADSSTTLAQLGIGSYDAVNGVGQMLQVGPSSTVRWTNTIDGGTY